MKNSFEKKKRSEIFLYIKKIREKKTFLVFISTFFFLPVEEKKDVSSFPFMSLLFVSSC